VLPEGRLVSGGLLDDRLLLWEAGASAAAPVELGRHMGRVRVVAVLPEGQLVSGGFEGRLLLWEAGASAAAPVELDRHEGPVTAVAVLPDGRLVSGDDRRVRLWDVTTRSEIAQLRCSSRALAAEAPARDGTLLVIAHAGPGVSLWVVRAAVPS
jgi:WD40 repeat protein